MGRAYGTHGTDNLYKILVWKPEMKRLLGSPRYRWEDNIKVDLKVIGCEGMD